MVQCTEGRKLKYSKVEVSHPTSSYRINHTNFVANAHSAYRLEAPGPPAGQMYSSNVGTQNDTGAVHAANATATGSLAIVLEGTFTEVQLRDCHETDHV